MEIINRYKFNIILSILVGAGLYLLGGILLYSVLYGLSAGLATSYLPVYKEFLRAKEKAVVAPFGKKGVLLTNVLSVLFFIMVGVSLYLAETLDLNIGLNAILLVLLSLFLGITTRSHYVYVKEDMIYLSKLIKISDVIRFKAVKGRKNKNVQVKLTYMKNGTATDKYLYYSDDLVKFLEENLPKKTRG